MSERGSVYTGGVTKCRLTIECPRCRQTFAIDAEAFEAQHGEWTWLTVPATPKQSWTHSHKCKGLGEQQEAQP